MRPLRGPSRSCRRAGVRREGGGGGEIGEDRGSARGAWWRQPGLIQARSYLSCITSITHGKTGQGLMFIMPTTGSDSSPCWQAALADERFRRPYRALDRRRVTAGRDKRHCFPGISFCRVTNPTLGAILSLAILLSLFFLTGKCRFWNLVFNHFPVKVPRWIVSITGVILRSVTWQRGWFYTCQFLVRTTDKSCLISRRDRSVERLPLLYKYVSSAGPQPNQSSWHTHATQITLPSCVKKTN